MKKFSLFPIVFLFCHQLLLAQPGSGMNMSHKDSGHVMLNKTEFKWTNAPPALNKGAMMTVIDGDPSKEGMFTIRLSFPANYKIAPHWHPTAEHVTIIEGNFYMGGGEKFDEKKAMLLKQGGYATMPAHYAHYAFAKTKCIVQIHAMGPFVITYINPADDPRTK